MNVENTHQVTGKIAVIKPTETVGNNGFQKRELYLDITDNPDYPNHCKLEFQKDNVSLLDSYKVGDTVTVAFNLSGRTWTSPEGKKVFFQTCRAWKISSANATSPAHEPVAVTPEVLQEEDDLPF